MITLIRTHSGDQGFVALVNRLNEYLTIIDGTEHDFYDQFNGIDNLKFVVVAYDQNEAVGCGAIKEFDTTTMEVKRMFVHPEFRGKGVAQQILTELEKWTKEMGKQKCVLETGKRMQDAVRFYGKSGYAVIPNFAPYTSMENSICFEKIIR